jgi:predicted acetyltransferase
MWLFSLVVRECGSDGNLGLEGLDRLWRGDVARGKGVQLDMGS